MGQSDTLTGTAEPYDRAIAYARTLGAEHGRNVAGWYAQDAIGGRATGDTAATARRILAGIEDGDPAVLDTFPAADLSGQWADTLTGPALYRNAVRAGFSGAARGTRDGDERTAVIDSGEWFADVCDAYSDAYSEAAEDAIAAAARAVLA